MRIENSFIPVRGVGERTERSLWEEGVLTWEAFDPSAAPVGEKTGQRIETFVADALERLDDGDARYFGDAFPSGERWRLYENFREDTCFFDIETTGLDSAQNDVTTVSFHRDGETTTLVRGHDLTAETLREQFTDAALVASFNGKRFDVPFLEDNFDISIDTPHIDLMYPCRRLDLTGGLKSIEKEVGIDRDRPDLSGRDAVRLWHQYERDGDEDALDTLVSYNRDDTANLSNLMDVVVESLHADSIGPFLE
ncbi:exonuclease [Halogeometricum borinquense]|uniref:Exonuclease n=1 Tax=Halogeometricum borinquense TaxID=60847 RepID=A0A6C0UGD3_9EURY|nr:ribonuclease H-like domain-containing protein [Halogeometricum borinquense]QIB74584.1 exonuclease [Halogeometricum borinquense]QIQ76469.1 exonuclease [Halogeometricum borinquense]